LIEPYYKINKKLCIFLCKSCFLFIDDQHTQHDIEAKQTILSNIEKFGCHLALLEPDNYLPGFVYSIGLYKNYGHPEIICFGLKTEVMASIINHARDLVKS